MIAHVNQFRARGSSMDVVRCNQTDVATRAHLADALMDALARAACWEAMSGNSWISLKGLDTIAFEKAKLLLPRLVRASLDNGVANEITKDAGYERAMLLATSATAADNAVALDELGASAGTPASSMTTPSLVAGGELTDLKSRLDAFVAESARGNSHGTSWLLSRARGTDATSSSLEPPAEKFLLVKERLEREEVWTKSDRLAFAEVLINSCDKSGVAHCLETFFRSEEAEQHRRIECKFRPVLCSNEGCTEMFSARAFEAHDKVCRFKPVACTRDCGHYIPRHLLAAHLADNCALRPVRCKFARHGCTATVTSSSLESHYRDACHHHLHLLENVVASQDSQLSEYDTRMCRLLEARRVDDERMKKIEKENVLIEKEHSQNARLMVRLQTEVRGLREELRKLQFKS